MDIEQTSILYSRGRLVSICSVPSVSRIKTEGLSLEIEMCTCTCVCVYVCVCTCVCVYVCVCV
jgi:hypothetical protein